MSSISPSSPEGAPDVGGVSATSAWRTLDPAVLKGLRPYEVRDALKSSVPREALDGDKVRSLCLWALKWGRVRKGEAKSSKGINEQKRRVQTAKNVLLYIKYLLQYDLCPADSLHPIYETFLTAMMHHSILRSVLSDVLCAITESCHVTRWRVRLLQDLASFYYKGSQGKEMKGVVNLIHKFRFLRPEIIPQSLMNYRLKPQSPSASACDSLGRRFESVWRDRTRIEYEFDDLVPATRLTWNNDQVYRGVGAPDDDKSEGEDQQPPSKRGRRLPSSRAHLRQLLGGPESNPIVEQLRKGNSTGRGGGGGVGAAPRTFPLSKCRTVGDVYDNLPRLEMPARTLSLLGNRGTLFLLAVNRDKEEMRKRLALSLHYVLYNEFFAAEGGGQSSIERKSFILQRVARLQDLFQQGIPVVARFLAEFLADWDGKSLFVEVIKLLPYIQITDYEELHECILLPLRKLFNSTFSPMERLLLLVYLHKLLLHWIGVEYGRVQQMRKGDGGESAANDDKKKGKKRRDCGGPFGRADSGGVGLESVGGDRGGTSTVDASKAPLASLAGLMTHWSLLAELGLVKAFVGRGTDLGSHRMGEVGEIKYELEGRRTDRAVFLNETSRLLIKKDIPLRSDVPLPFLYLSLFSRSSVFVSHSLELLSSAKHETIPACRRHLRRLEEEVSVYTVGAEEERAVVLDQLGNEAAAERLNVAVKDILSVLTNQTVYLDQGQSLFRRHWSIEDDFVREHLRLPTHPAFVPFTDDFVRTYASDNVVAEADVWKDLADEGTDVYASFLSHLGQSLPQIVMFLETFQKPRKVTHGKAHSQIGSQKSEGTNASNATSGISSMQPSRKSTRIKKKKVM